jgi:hypothetical protein
MTSSRALPLFGAAALGFALAACCFSAVSPRPASAQFQKTFSAQPLGNVNLSTPSVPGVPQPIEIATMDAQHFVVATREPRLVEQSGREGAAQQMVIPVVTYYSVRGDRLVPIEHAKPPTGYRVVNIQE